jgi:hypothetical protein
MQRQEEHRPMLINCVACQDGRKRADIAIEDIDEWLRKPGCFVCARSQEHFRDVDDHLARISTAIDGIRETIGTPIQVNLSMVTIEESGTTGQLAGFLQSRFERAGWL